MITVASDGVAASAGPAKSRQESDFRLKLILSIPALVFGYFFLALGLTIMAGGACLYDSGSWLLGQKLVSEILGEDEEK